MNTDDLIQQLGQNLRPVNPRAPQQRAMSLGALALGASLVLLQARFGLNPELAQILRSPAFALKLAFPAGLALVFAAMLWRLAHPGWHLGALAALLAPPVLLMATAALAAWLSALPDQGGAIWLGSTWRECSVNILTLSLPTAFAAAWFMRRMAPTRLRLAGACVGGLAGAVGALVYALHCPELAPPFLLLWNGLGIAAPAALGAWLGPKGLRW